MPSDRLTSDHLANERTHLAYVRSAVALISFGITINRFSVYLRDVRGGISHLGGWWSFADPAHLGIAMVVFGVVLVVAAALRFTRVTDEIERGTYKPSSAMAWAASGAVVLLGVLSLTWVLGR
jgi:putative membrane protein